MREIWKQAELQSRQEEREYAELLEWLDHAEQVLHVVDRPVTDREDEYGVNFVTFIAQNIVNVAYKTYFAYKMQITPLALVILIY